MSLVGFLEGFLDSFLKFTFRNKGRDTLSSVSGPWVHFPAVIEGLSRQFVVAKQDGLGRCYEGRRKFLRPSNAHASVIILAVIIIQLHLRTSPFRLFRPLIKRQLPHTLCSRRGGEATLLSRYGRERENSTLRPSPQETKAKRVAHLWMEPTWCCHISSLPCARRLAINCCSVIYRRFILQKDTIFLR